MKTPTPSSPWTTTAKPSFRKFRRAVTDSDTRIVAAEDKPGISNLLTIYSLFANKTVKEAEREFEGKGYGEFKLAVGETVADALEPVRAEKIGCWRIRATWKAS